MDPIERLARGLADVLTVGDDAAIDAVFAPDYIEEYPQSGERIVGRESVRAMLANFPVATRPTVRGEPRVTRTADGFVGEYDLDYGPDGIFRTVGLYTVRDGLIVHGREYFAAPFEPAAWRAPWIEATG